MKTSFVNEVNQVECITLVRRPMDVQPVRCELDTRITLGQRVMPYVAAFCTVPDVASSELQPDWFVAGQAMRSMET